MKLISSNPIKNRLYPAIALLALFALSIMVRWPYINRPLSTNYEWVTAHTLVTLQIWEEEGAFAHRFNPIYTFTNPNDHFIKCPISGISDEVGNYYYVSYPPFAFIFAHTVFNLLGVYPNVLALESLNLTLHFVCAWLIYLILNNLTNAKERLSLPALVGTSIYIFAPLSLWHHSNVYFSDILVQTIFLLGIYLSHFFCFKKGKKVNFIKASLFIVLYLMAYTEWIGFLFAGCLFLVGILFRKQVWEPRSLMFLAFASATLAGLTVLLQYSSINGLQNFIDTAINRYTERSGHTGNHQFYQLDSHLFLANLYLRNYFPQFVIIGFSSFLLLILKARFKGMFRVDEQIVLFLALAPSLLHHLLLFEFTLVHDMALVKTCVFLSLLTGLLLDRINQETIKISSITFKVIPYVVVACMLVLSTYLYNAHVIEPEGFSFKQLGNQIKENATPEDTVFFKTTRTLGDFIIAAPENFVIAPQIQYYAGRCIQVVPNLEAAKSHLETYNKPKGVVFTIENPKYLIEEIEHISIQDTIHLDILHP